MAKNITEMPINDRPYEKLELYGEATLSNSELLAIIIKTGTVKLNCLQVAKNVLSLNNNTNLSDLEYLSNLSLEELKSFEGIGRVKAIQIKAVVELSKRISKTYEIKKDKITCPNDVFNLLNQKYIGKKQESLKTILLNKQKSIISVVTNAIGTNDNINIGIKEVFSEPIKHLANSIILVHNHPSGSLQPSKNDIYFTKKIDEYSSIFNIELLDHVIIANNNYISMKELRKF